MTAGPYGLTIFCDDIRQEVNGKLTLVGCYGSDLHILGTYPAVLPTLAAHINIRLPFSLAIESLKIVVTKEDSGGVEEIMSMEADTSEASKPDEEMKDQIIKGEKILSILVPFKWSPVQFLSDGKIKVRGYIDGTTELKLGSLTVSLYKVDDAAPI